MSNRLLLLGAGRAGRDTPPPPAPPPPPPMTVTGANIAPSGFDLTITFDVSDSSGTQTFTVNVDGSVTDFNTLTNNGSQVSGFLGSQVFFGSVVTLDYSPGGDPVVSATDSPLAAFSGFPVTGGA